MSIRVAISADTLSNGTYSLEAIDRVLDEKRTDTGMTMDITTGNIVFCGRHAGWTKKARHERLRGDLAMLNVLRHSADDVAVPYARALVDAATQDVVHRKRPLTSRRVRALVQELRSLRAAAERGKDFLILHTARTQLAQDTLLEETRRAMNSPALEAALKLPANRSVLMDAARDVLAVIRELFRQQRPEYLFNLLFSLLNGERKIAATLSEDEPGIHPKAAVSARSATRHVLPHASARPRFLGLSTEVGACIVVSALRRAGMDTSFVASLRGCTELPELRGFFKDMCIMSRSECCLDLHPEISGKIADMLDVYMRILRQFPGSADEGLFPVRVDTHAYNPKLRALAAEFFALPEEYHQAEASEELCSTVLRNLVPTEPFDPRRTGDAPYQLEKIFICDVPREVAYMTVWIPGPSGDGSTSERVRVDFSDLQDELSAGRLDNALFAERVARQICGDDRKAVYALSCILNQGICNSVLFALFALGPSGAPGFNVLPVVFGVRGYKDIEVERLPSGDLTVSMLWKPSVRITGILDPATHTWEEERFCDPRRSRFGVDVSVRLRREDIEQGRCLPVLDRLHLGIGITYAP